MDKTKKYSLFPLILAMTFLLATSFVRADDDESDDDGEDNYSAPVATQDSSSQPAKTVTKTIILEPAKIITSTIMQDVLLIDSDRDGIPNEQDLYPNIANQLIVDDLNLDGIDDRFEIQTAL